MLEKAWDMPTASTHSHLLASLLGLPDLPHLRPLLIPGRELWTARPASSIRPGLWVSTSTLAEILIPDAR